VSPAGPRDLPPRRRRIQSTGMLDGWHRRGSNECAALFRSPVCILVEYHHPESGSEATLFADGLVESRGLVPVEVLQQLVAEWHVGLRGKIA
jgi:hypothetical protein